MLYKDLQRVQELDSEISKMHERLAQYYRERAELTEGVFSPEVSPERVAKIARKQPKGQNPTEVTYEALKTIWQPITGAFPTYKTLEKRIEQAVTLRDNWQAADSMAVGTLSIVAVPPQGKLAKYTAENAQFVFMDEGLRPQGRGGSWNIIVVSSGVMAEPVTALADDMGAAQFAGGEYDNRALGVAELIAAEVQGVHVAQPDEWTLLLKKADTLSRVPCATRQDDKIIFDIDDARCLIGENVIYPAIAVN